MLVGRLQHQSGERRRRYHSDGFKVRGARQWRPAAVCRRRRRHFQLQLMNVSRNALKFGQCRVHYRNESTS